MIKLFAIFTSIFLTTLAHAQVSEIGPITSGGAGCINGNFRSSVKSNAIHISYPTFEIQMDRNLRAIERKTCSLIIPVDVPAGFRLQAAATSSGLSRLQGVDRAKLSQELFLAGSQAPVQSMTLAASNKLFTLGKPNAANSAVSTACGQQALLRLNLSATVQQFPSTKSPSKLAITKTQITLRLVPCQ